VKLPDEDSVLSIRPEHTFEGHTRSVSSVCCTQDYVISGSVDKMIMIWCLKRFCQLRTLMGHSIEVTWVHILSTNRLLSASKDGTMKVWDLSVGRNVPSDEELRDLIRVRHTEYGYSHSSDEGNQLNDVTECC